MHTKVLNVLGMRQVLFLRVVAVVLLPMVDLVLVLVVAMMAWAEPEVRQLDALGVGDGEFGVRDCTAAVYVKEREDLVDCCLFGVFVDVRSGPVE